MSLGYFRKAVVTMREFNGLPLSYFLFSFYIFIIYSLYITIVTPLLPLPPIIAFP